MKVEAGIDRLDSGKYRARYRCSGCQQHQGEPKQHSKAFDRLKDARDWRTAQLASVRSGTHVTPSGVTVQVYAQQWSDSRNYRPSSRRQATTYLNHLKATPLGRRPVGSVRPSDIQGWIRNRSDVLAPTTMRNVYIWLKAVFASAVEDGLIGRTPCTSKISLPERDDHDFIPLTTEQVYALADAMPDRYRAAVYVQSALGLRVSELLGLQVQDVDFLRTTVRIERQLLRDGRTFGKPKTKKSRRSIPLVGPVVPVLAEHIRQFPPNDDGVIFTTIYGNPVRQDQFSDRVFNPAVRKAGLPEDTTSHDLRHHFATELLAQLVPVTVVAKYLGHSSAKLVLETYGHPTTDAEQVVRAALDRVWSSCVTESVTDAQDGTGNVG